KKKGPECTGPESIGLQDMSDIFDPEARGNGGQLELFGSTRPLVPAPQPCRRCGGLMATLSSSRGPHAGELRCADCDLHVMWVGHVRAAEIRGGFVTGLSTYVPGDAP